MIVKRKGEEFFYTLNLDSSANTNNLDILLPVWLPAFEVAESIFLDIRLLILLLYCHVKLGIHPMIDWTHALIKDDSVCNYMLLEDLLIFYFCLVFILFSW